LRVVRPVRSQGRNVPTTTAISPTAIPADAARSGQDEPPPNRAAVSRASGDLVIAVASF
jgi:hypothetical protein